MEDANQAAANGDSAAEDPDETQSLDAGSDVIATTSDWVAVDNLSAGPTSESRPEATTRRNYRRRTVGSDDSDSDAAVEPEISPNVVNQPNAETDSDEMSLDELRVNMNDDDNNQNARR